jgi:thioredoxin 1
MAGKNVIALSDANFDEEVVNSTSPVLVDFTASWCGPCKQLAPIVEKLADESVGKYKIAKLDIDECPAIARKFGIKGVPTVMVFKGGEKTGHHVGLASKEKLVALLEG